MTTPTPAPSTGTPWTPDQPLRADATAAQIEARYNHVHRHWCSGEPAVSVTIAREYAAALSAPPVSGTPLTLTDDDLRLLDEAVMRLREETGGLPGWRAACADRLAALCERFAAAPPAEPVSGEPDIGASLRKIHDSLMPPGAVGIGDVLSRATPSRPTRADVEALERHNPSMDFDGYPEMSSTRTYHSPRYKKNPGGVRSEGDGEWLRRDDVLALFSRSPKEATK